MQGKLESKDEEIKERREKRSEQADKILSTFYELKNFQIVKADDILEEEKLAYMKLNKLKQLKEE